MTTEFDRQVILDLFLTPVVFAMEMIGMGALALWGLEALSPFYGALVGFGGILGGIGWGISRILLNPDKVLEDTLVKRKERQRQAQDKELDAFDEKLTDARDWEVRTILRNLRAVRKEFLRVLPTVMDGLRDENERDYQELFDRNVVLLRNSHETLLSVREVKIDRVKKPFLERRTKAINSVKTSIVEMTNYVAGLAEAMDVNDEVALGSRHDALRANLQLMRDVEEEMGDMATMVRDNL